MTELCEPVFTKPANFNAKCFSSQSGATRYCDFAVGAGVYVDDQGQLMPYGVEHDKDGYPGSTRMGEGAGVRAVRGEAQAITGEGGCWTAGTPARRVATPVEHRGPRPPHQLATDPSRRRDSMFMIKAGWTQRGALVQVFGRAAEEWEISMNEALERLAKQLDLAAPSNMRLRLEFGHECVLRVKHLLEEPAVLECLSTLGDYLNGSLTHAQLEKAATEAAGLANQHQGSKSIDGCGHAAVSATYAVANAISGRALQAAEYAAYASVYGQGGYGAVGDLGSFQMEFAWQVRCLASLSSQRSDKRSGADAPLCGLPGTK